ncbi:tetratricopeptide repeat protein [Paenirhodobacter sp. CAU 1674]|uniref:tetratricopeptide repeat protein n=1 Tax=Paenirhodobacter sp. CAU 1674 TaxID=3032596 RepID=UPI0023DAD04E|nr:tetratricopeptide repeat protein [Paenirhodobacter sp. CAU 1674]MDF2142829.1 tetratricopeptide repeat protein [Paenirhodobacter sp. CAU 1674]
MTSFVSRQLWRTRGLRIGVCVAALAVFAVDGTLAQTGAAPTHAQGMALIYGAEGVTPDVDAGMAILRDLAAAGDVVAQRDLGEMLIGGWAGPSDPATGRALLETAAAAGDVKAQLSLGTFLLYGSGLPKDMERARELFEQAADRGDPTGLRLYGEALMWSQKDPKAAQAYLVRAGEMGQGAAWAILAEGAMYGYLGGGKTSRMKFDDFARRARAMGNERIEVLDAMRQMWGISMRADGPATLAKLGAAADAGNAEAARYLIGLVRDGNGLNIRKEPARAATLVERHAALLSPVEQWRYGFTIATAKTKQLRAYAGLQEQLAAAPEPVDADFGKDLFKANPNFAIYLLQARMKQAGQYTGKLDGLAGEKTLRGLSRMCRATLDRNDCGHGVLRGELIGALIAAQ